MRAPLLLAAVLLLAGCSNNDQAGNSQNVDENLTAENIVSNDVTAIDAVTGDAANMAADAEINDVGNVNANVASMPSAPKPKPQARKAPTMPQPATNSSSNAPANAD